MSQDKWEREAGNLLKAELARDGIKYKDLALLLQAIGVEESEGAIAAKINRGTFSFFFFLQCMKAIGHSDIRLNK